MNIPTDKQKALESAMVQIERQFGKGSIMKLGSQAVLDVPVISSGSLALDKALGTGGLPGAGSVKFSGRKHPVKQPLRFTRLPRLRNKAVLQPLSTPSMPLTRPMPRNSV